MKPLFNVFLLLIFSMYGNAQEIRSFKEGQLYGFKKEGKIIIQPKYDYAFDFNEGLALVEKNGLWGFVDEQNVEVIQCVFDQCSEFNKGFATVVLNNKIGLIDSSGTYVVPPECSEVRVLKNGVCIGKKGGKFALFSQGRRLTDFFYDEISTSYCDIFGFKQGAFYGVLTSEGKELIPAESSQRISCYPDEKHGKYFVGKSNKLARNSYYSSNGELIIDGDEYEATQVKYPVIYSRTKNGTSSIINVATGDEVLPPTEIEEYDVNWRPCDGYGYRSPSQLIFQKGEGLLMVSTKSPYNQIEISKRPIILNEFILVQNETNKTDVYSHNLELLAKDVNMKISNLNAFNIEERICSFKERNLLLWKNDQFAVWDETAGAINFVESFSQNDSSIFQLNHGDLESQVEFNAITHHDQSILFEVNVGNSKFLYLIKEGAILWDLVEVGINDKVKFKKFEFDEYQEDNQNYKEIHTVYLKINGRKKSYSW